MLGSDGRRMQSGPPSLDGRTAGRRWQSRETLGDHTSRYDTEPGDTPWHVTGLLGSVNVTIRLLAMHSYMRSCRLLIRGFGLQVPGGAPKQFQDRKYVRRSMSLADHQHALLT